MNLFRLRGKSLVTWILISLFALGYVGFASGESNFLVSCPIKKGDSLAKIKEFYGISLEPTATQNPRPGIYDFSYHFSEYGVWIFFDGVKQVQSVRFDRPFAGKIEGVSIGDSKEDVLKLKGEPAKQVQGLPDSDAVENTKKLKLEIIEKLPDPSPKELVRDAFKEIEQIDSRPLMWNAAWLYQIPSRGLLRYDFGSLSGKVQTILSDRGTDDAEQPTTTK